MFKKNNKINSKNNPRKVKDLKLTNNESQFFIDKQFLLKIINNERQLLHKRHMLFHEKDIFEIEYNINEYGFRTTFNNQKIMALGCSHTAGIGLPEKYRWSNVLSEKIGRDIVNLAFPGDSAITQIRNAFWYFKNFGNPKIIFAIFPILRMPFPMVPEKNISLRKYVPDEKSVENFKYQLFDFNLGMEKFEKIAKAPYDMSSVVAAEAAIYYNNLAIEMLDQYCEQNGILFFWSIWETDLRLVDSVESIYKEKYPRYIEIDAIKWQVSKRGDNSSAYDGPMFADEPLKCHEDILLQNPKIFAEAADRADGTDKSDIGWGHWGTHRHVHIAEAFYDKVKPFIKEKEY